MPKERGFLVLMLLVLFSSSAICDQTYGAILLASGPVALNGTSTNGGSAVFIGDTIETRDSSVTLSRQGTTISAPAKSTIVYRESTIELAAGSLEVRTVSGMSVTASQVNVSPVSGNAIFQVKRQNGEILIAAKSGDLRVADGVSQKIVQQGQTATVDDQRGKRPAVVVVPRGNAGFLTFSDRTAMEAGAAVAVVGTTLAIVTRRAHKQGPPIRTIPVSTN